MTDKIFNNTFEDSNYENDPTFSFNLDPSISDEKDEEEKIYFENLSAEIDKLIENHHTFYLFNRVDDFGNTKKVKKNDINEMFQYIVSELQNQYSIMDIFSEFTKYFRINPKKAYKSLNLYLKEDLVQALDKKTNALKKRNIQKLF